MPAARRRGSPPWHCLTLYVLCLVPFGETARPERSMDLDLEEESHVNGNEGHHLAHGSSKKSSQKKAPPDYQPPPGNVAKLKKRFEPQNPKDEEKKDDAEDKDKKDDTSEVKTEGDKDKEKTDDTVKTEGDKDTEKKDNTEDDKAAGPPEADAENSSNDSSDSNSSNSSSGSQPEEEDDPFSGAEAPACSRHPNGACDVEPKFIDEQLDKVKDSKYAVFKKVILMAKTCHEKSRAECSEELDCAWDAEYDMCELAYSEETGAQVGQQLSQYLMQGSDIQEKCGSCLGELVAANVKCMETKPSKCSPTCGEKKELKMKATKKGKICKLKTECQATQPGCFWSTFGTNYHSALLTCSKLKNPADCATMHDSCDWSTNDTQKKCTPSLESGGFLFNSLPDDCPVKKLPEVLADEEGNICRGSVQQECVRNKECSWLEKRTCDEEGKAPSELFKCEKKELAQLQMDKFKALLPADLLDATETALNALRSFFKGSARCREERVCTRDEDPLKEFVVDKKPEEQPKKDDEETTLKPTTTTTTTEEEEEAEQQEEQEEQVETDSEDTTTTTTSSTLEKLHVNAVGKDGVQRLTQ
eukprot:TRINITY_DN6691_c0_g1_i1.p1 TRINITY_DN6691_c0_g1~~TRINITY_DN6691_c0_g1_i1.p1  ORF type:complete len:587 (+),score=171.36 TRINITY_DN6691_c0_g1_i1:84-1844(+)